VVSLEISRCYGPSLTPSSLQNHWKRVLKKDARLICDTVAAGGNPELLQLGVMTKGGSRENSQAVVSKPSSAHGTHLLVLLIHLWRKLTLISLPEISRCFGRSLGPNTIANHYQHTLKYQVMGLLSALENGEDPELVDLADATALRKAGRLGLAKLSKTPLSTLYLFDWGETHIPFFSKDCPQIRLLGHWPSNSKPLEQHYEVLSQSSQRCVSQWDQS
jgi:hypothetical protein